MIKPLFKWEVDVVMRLSLARALLIGVFMLPLSSCKQRQLNSDAKPDAAGAIYDGKENFIWPLLSVSGPNLQNIDVCWYGLSRKQDATRDPNDRYTPAQMRTLFGESLPFGGEKGAHFHAYSDFLAESERTSTRVLVKDLGGLGACVAALTLPNRLKGKWKLIAAAGSGTFCLGSVIRGVVADAGKADTISDLDLNDNFENILQANFYQDARIPDDTHRALIKTIQQVVRTGSSAAKEPCPVGHDAIERADQALRKMQEQSTRR